MVKRFSIVRLGMLLSATLAVGLASADQIKPIKTVTLSRPVIDSTHNYFPQINHVVNKSVQPRSENRANRTKPGTPNDLPLGTVLGTLDRGKAGAKFAGIGFTGYVPPDCDLGVGPNHIVAVVNTSWAIYTKTGTPLFEQTYDDFFSTQVTGGILSDPKVFYDSISKRWFMTIINPDFTALTSKQLIAVSDDSDPTGTWFKYVVNTKLTENSVSSWLDYPGFGFNKHSLVVTGNMFGFTAGFQGSYLFTIQMAELLAGGTPKVSFFRLPDISTVQTARTYTATEDTVFGLGVNSLSSLIVVAFTGLPASPVMDTMTLTVPDFLEPNWDEGARSPGGRELDTLDSRHYNLAFRDGTMVAAHNVRKDNGQKVVRWYEIKTNNWPVASGADPELVQSGEIPAGAGTDTHMPAINKNAAGDIGIVYTRSGTTLVADLMFAGRKATDPPGAVGTPKLVARSPGATYGFPGDNRWGDYFGNDVDPTDGLTFWVYGMIGDGDIFWQTVFASYQISTQGGVKPVEIAPGSITKTEGGTYTGGLAHVLGSDNSFFTVNSAAVTRVGQVASVLTTYSVPATLNFLSLKMSFEGMAASGVTTSVFAYDWTLAKYVYLGAFPLTGTEQVKTFKIVTSDWSKYINGARQMKLVTRAVMPNTLYATAFPFQFKLDAIKLLPE